MTWNLNKLEELKKSGMIKDYVFIYGRGDGKNHAREVMVKSKKSKGLDWLELNITYWCNSKAIELIKEHRFCDDRGWRFDFAMPSIKVAVEFEGGVHKSWSGHKTPKHYTKDAEKYNRANMLGWKVLRYTAMNYSTCINDLNKIIQNYGTETKKS